MSNFQKYWAWNPMHKRCDCNCNDSTADYSEITDRLDTIIDSDNSDNVNSSFETLITNQTNNHGEISEYLETIIKNNKNCCNRTNKNLNEIENLLEKLIETLSDGFTSLESKLNVIIDDLSDETSGYEEWSTYIDKLLVEGTIVSYNGIDYRVMQDVYPNLTQTPDSDGMLAIYMIYRGSDTYEWLYGEYVEVGWIRTEDGVEYIAIQYPNMNTCSPSTVASVWAKV